MVTKFIISKLVKFALNFTMVRRSFSKPLLKQLKNKLIGFLFHLNIQSKCFKAESVRIYITLLTEEQSREDKKKRSFVCSILH